MVNHLRHWPQILFGARLRIPLMVLSSFQIIGFWITLRGLSCFRVTPGLVVPAHPLPFPVRRSVEFSMCFIVGFKYIGLVFLWCHVGWYFMT